MSDLNAVRKSRLFLVAAGAAVDRMNTAKQQMFHSFFALGMLAYVSLEGMAPSLVNAITETAQQAFSAEKLTPAQTVADPTRELKTGHVVWFSGFKNDGPK